MRGDPWLRADVASRSILQPSLNPDHGFRVPDTAPRRRYLARVQLGGDGACRQVGQLREDWSQYLVTLGGVCRLPCRQLGIAQLLPRAWLPQGLRGCAA